MNNIVEQLITQSEVAGFTGIGCTTVDDTSQLHEHFSQWVREQRHGNMQWMERNIERRSDPRNVVPNAQRVIMLSYNYWTDHQHSSDPLHGRISRYAWGTDYHDIITPKVRALDAWLCEQFPGSASRSYVDTGPVLEKTWAERTGIGWQGKHTCLINPTQGSWCFLAAIITDAALPEFCTTDRRGLRNEHPTRETLCGTCTRCIDICPTSAITAPYQLDARRCISYLTIEHHGIIPREMRSLLGNHIYGCDLCQDVCPWNRFATDCGEYFFEPRPGTVAPELIEFMYMDIAQFRERFRKSPIKRIKLPRLLRNVAIALGNSKDPATIPALTHGLKHDDPIVRAHCVWALQQIAHSDAAQQLTAHAATEKDPQVIQELTAP